MGTLFLKHPNTPAEKLGCESCHGEAAEHVALAGKSFKGMIRFTKCSQNILTSAARSVSSAIKRGSGFSGRAVFMRKKASVHYCHTAHTGPGATEALSTRQIDRIGYLQNLS